MTTLIAYIFVVTTTSIWIACDPETDDVFLFCAYRVGWQMKMWSATLILGAKLAALTGLVALGCYLAICVPVPDVKSQLIVRGLLLAVPLMLLRAPRLLAIKRYKAKVEMAMTNLANFARQNNDADLSVQHQPAEYATHSDWTAWHPKDELWPNPDTQQIWNGVVPILYASSSAPRSLIIPFDFQTFLVWNGPIEIPADDFLPFSGPGNTRFKYLRQRKVKNQQWWLIRAKSDF